MPSVSFPGKDVLFWLVLSTLTVPAQVTLIPGLLLAKDLNLLDSYPGVILPGFADVFGVFLMKQYIQTLPSELEGAGRVDGASEWQIYWHIILPLCTPALAVLAIFTFQRYWNSFILPLVVLRDSFKYPDPGRPGHPAGRVQHRLRHAHDRRRRRRDPDDGRLLRLPALLRRGHPHRRRSRVTDFVVESLRAFSPGVPTPGPRSVESPTLRSEACP